MKPKTLMMAVPTMVVITAGFAALFFYIEETKYEALVYKKELDKLQANIEQVAGFQHLAKEIATQAPNTAIATLYRSKSLNDLSGDEISNIVATQQSKTLTDNELKAVKRLMDHD